MSLLFFNVIFVAISWRCLGYPHRVNQASSLRKIQAQHATTLIPNEVSFNPREERRFIAGKDNYNRNGFEDSKAQVKTMISAELSSPLIAELRANKGSITRDGLTVKLAEFCGMCWGVERAISMAYEARAHFPDKKIHITNEIVHNPMVNERLQEMNINFLKSDDLEKDLNLKSVGHDDVVILPAHGVPIQDLMELNEKGVKIVDTTCPWVTKVWTAVDKFNKKSYTSVIHGKWAHAESIATASYCEHYIIVRDMEEAKYVSKYILEGGNKEEFLEKFKHAISVGFDPDVHLKQIGVANQTTMYKRETKEIGRLLETTMLKKFGPLELSSRYSESDTICDATQERQDAVTDLVIANHHDAQDTEQQQQLDFVLVLGGFKSDNTGHLREIPEKYGVPAYHIDRAERIGADNSITHRDRHGEIVTTHSFLRKDSGRPLVVGVTSGASTPNKYLEDAIERLFLIYKLL